MFEILAKNPLFEVVFSIYNASDEAVAALDHQLEDLASKMGIASLGVQVDSRELGENHLLEDASLFEKKLDRYKVRNFFNENDIIKELEQTRLIVDTNCRHFGRNSSDQSYPYGVCRSFKKWICLGWDGGKARKSDRLFP